MTVRSVQPGLPLAVTDAVSYFAYAVDRRVRTQRRVRRAIAASVEEAPVKVRFTHSARAAHSLPSSATSMVTEQSMMFPSTAPSFSEFTILQRRSQQTAKAVLSTALAAMAAAGIAVTHGESLDPGTPMNAVAIVADSAAIFASLLQWHHERLVADSSDLLQVMGDEVFAYRLLVGALSGDTDVTTLSPLFHREDVLRTAARNELASRMTAPFDREQRAEVAATSFPGGLSGVDAVLADGVGNRYARSSARYWGKMPPPSSYAEASAFGRLYGLQEAQVTRELPSAVEAADRYVKVLKASWKRKGFVRFAELRQFADLLVAINEQRVGDGLGPLNPFLDRHRYRLTSLFVEAGMSAEEATQALSDTRRGKYAEGLERYATQDRGSASNLPVVDLPVAPEALARSF